MYPKIFLFGVPRSGTTWLSRVLSASGSYALVHEPDNETNLFMGLVSKCGLPRFPYVRPSERKSRYQNLFKYAANDRLVHQTSKRNALMYRATRMSRRRTLALLASGEDVCSAIKLPVYRISKHLLTKRRPRKRVIVKSVHGVLSLPFLLKHVSFKPVIIQRNPLNIFSSYKAMEMPDQNRHFHRRTRLLADFDVEPLSSRGVSGDVLAGYQLGVFNKVIDTYKEAYADIHVIDYEEVMLDPYREIERICGALGIAYGDTIRSFLTQSFRRGKGYTTHRLPSEQRGVYKTRLSTAEMDAFEEGYVLGRGTLDFERL